MKVALALGALHVSSLRYPSDPLYEKQQTLDRFRFSNGSPRHQAPRREERLRRALSPGGKFEFFIESLENASIVFRFITALQIAGGFIENAISLQNKVTVKVQYGDVCGETEGCR
ncbi:hypothetical protein DSO57_1023360 [Entomophthora muscae]|uniref:Uncharacterized protein n=1 Tax=Entomophthora muscae TaxID=34485 RepID=A0ACC2S4S9_9FUNG|nr:hypothetical protein DSO57_1023360 [Entomophthora muscae]